jgi:HD-GYP domain-containing protein (c-di-GMP phosphodiesterase class II)
MTMADELGKLHRLLQEGVAVINTSGDWPRERAPVVAFEHHLRQDLSGYPERIGHRDLNLCTMLVSIADVFDALSSKRVYKPAFPIDKCFEILQEW